MYIKGFTYVGFALLFMRLGNVITDTIGDSLGDIGEEVHQEQVLATTQSLQKSSFTLPGVYIMFPGTPESGFYEYGCSTLQKE